MKKKLTKEQKEKRQHFLKVTKNVVFYISLALNVLVIIAFAITGCSPKSNVQSIDRQDLGEATQLRKEKAFDFSNTNDNAAGFDLTKISLIDSNFSYSGNFQSSVSNVYTMVSSDVNPYYVNQINVNCNISHPLSNGNSLIISTNLSSQENIYTYSNGVWSNNALVIDKIFINSQNSVLNNTPLGIVLKSLFPNVSYQNYDLAYGGFNPYVYYPGSYGYQIVGNNDPISLSDPFILKSAVFYIRGEAYNELRIQWAKALGTTRYYRNGELVGSHGEPGSVSYPRFINLVYAKNTSTGSYIKVWVANVSQVDEDGSTVYNVDLSGQTLNDYNNQQIKLFDVNLNQATLEGYFNGNALTANYNGSSSTVVNTTSNNVFGLFSQAFAGITQIFSIQILPGLTLGILIFLPLVVIIIFAIIRIIKK